MKAYILRGYANGMLLKKNLALLALYLADEKKNHYLLPRIDA